MGEHRFGTDGVRIINCGYYVVSDCDPGDETILREGDDIMLSLEKLFQRCGSECHFILSHLSLPSTT